MVKTGRLTFLILNLSVNIQERFLQVLVLDVHIHKNSEVLVVQGYGKRDKN